MVYELIKGVSYTALWNLLDYPVGIIPVTKVTAADVQETISIEDVSEYETFLKKATVGSEGLPVAVQCVGLPFTEELVLRVMKEIEVMKKIKPHL
ncbi:hypothetical protein ScPMuIL_001351 [Solemya velum]